MQIKETIKRYDLTISEVAKRMNIKQPTLTNIIKDGEKIRVSTLRRISEAIGCNISELLGEQPGTTITADNSVINIHKDTSTHKTSVCPWCGHTIDISVSIDKGSE